MKNLRFAHIISVFTLFMIALTPLKAHANLALTPTIVIFEDGDRFKDVVLINNTDTSKTYEMSWKFFQMQESGASYKEVQDPLGSLDVSKYVFYTPRRVTIPGGGSQKVRLAYRRPSEVADGDYYAHLLFSPADTPKINQDKIRQDSAKAGVGVKVGYSIPIIIRAGAFTEGGEIGQISISRNLSNKLVLNVPVIRPEGVHGTIGHLIAYHVSPTGEEEVIGEIANANVFNEIKQRIIGVSLNKEISGGQIKLVLKSGKKKDDTIFDQEIFPIN